MATLGRPMMPVQLIPHIVVISEAFFEPNLNQHLRKDILMPPDMTSVYPGECPIR